MPKVAKKSTFTREDWKDFIEWGVENGFWSNESDFDRRMGYGLGSSYRGTADGCGMIQERFMRLMALTNDYTLPNENTHM